MNAPILRWLSCGDSSCSVCDFARWVERMARWALLVGGVGLVALAWVVYLVARP